MYFITPKNSKTGKKFQKIADKANDEYFGFTIEEDWTDIVIPSDCTEITTSKYKELFKR